MDWPTHAMVGRIRPAGLFVWHQGAPDTSAGGTNEPALFSASGSASLALLFGSANEVALCLAQAIILGKRFHVMAANGTTDLLSSRSVESTIDRLEELLRSKGIKIFARIDQAAAAKEVGLSMRPTELLIFGDPRTGTPLMNQYPSLAIDLPLKAVAWESGGGKVYLTFNTADYLIGRHHLVGEPFKAMEALFVEATE